MPYSSHRPQVQDGDALAAIDLGSNSFHMVLAQHMLGQLRVVDRLRETVRMADGLDEKGGLDKQARQRALDCLARFGQRLRGVPRLHVRALATNTVRRLRDPQAFLRAAEAALGHPIEVVSGREEARLIYLGVAHAQPPKPGQQRLVIDIGGGSTEFIIGRGFEPVERESLQAGCIASTRRFFPGGRLSRKKWTMALTEISAEFQQFAGLYRALGWHEALGSSGTHKSISEICMAMKLTKGAITAEALPQVRDRLLQADHISRIDLPGLSSERRPIIAGGVLVLEAAFRALGLQKLLVSKAAMREGILYDLLGRFHKQDMREATVDEFMRRYHIDTQQAARVKRVAHKLLSASGSPADENALRFLDWAARLHEIGLSVSHGGYHRHSGYILENADMPGFSRTEQARLALLARAQRGALVKVPEFAEGRVSESDRLLVWLLRQAVILCRSRAEPRLPDVKVDLTGKRIRLELPEGWLERRPLTQRALDEDAVHWHAVGTRYVFA